MIRRKYNKERRAESLVYLLWFSLRHSTTFDCFYFARAEVHPARSIPKIARAKSAVYVIGRPAVTTPSWWLRDQFLSVNDLHIFFVKSSLSPHSSSPRKRSSCGDVELWMRNDSFSPDSAITRSSFHFSARSRSSKVFLITCFHASRHSVAKISSND